MVLYQPLDGASNPPFGFMTIGLEFTTSICTDPLAFLWLAMEGVTADSEIFWMMADLAMPVPAAGAPAFWTKNISSVAGYLINELVLFCAV
jgi:hypothetical protein